MINFKIVFDLDETESDDDDINMINDIENDLGENLKLLFGDDNDPIDDQKEIEQIDEERTNNKDNSEIEIDCKDDKNLMDIVKLNVGGQIFQTYRSTLKMYPNTMLGRMFCNTEMTNDKTKFF